MCGCSDSVGCLTIGLFDDLYSLLPQSSILPGVQLPG